MECRWTGKLFDDDVFCKLFVTQRELADLRAILARLTEEKIQLWFMVHGSWFREIFKTLKICISGI